MLRRARGAALATAFGILAAMATGACRPSDAGKAARSPEPIVVLWITEGPETFLDAIQGTIACNAPPELDPMCIPDDGRLAEAVLQCGSPQVTIDRAYSHVRYLHFPAGLHARFSSDAGAVMIGPQEGGLCLSAYDRGHLGALYADHERRRLAEAGSDAHRSRARATFGGVEERRYDADGTVTLPPMMRRKAGIGEVALFLGVGGAFEIWDPQVALDGDDPILREIAAWRSAESSALAN